MHVRAGRGQLWRGRDILRRAHQSIRGASSLQRRPARRPDRPRAVLVGGADCLGRAQSKRRSCRSTRHDPTSPWLRHSYLPHHQRTFLAGGAGAVGRLVVV